MKSGCDTRGVLPLRGPIDASDDEVGTLLLAFSIMFRAIPRRRRRNLLNPAYATAVSLVLHRREWQNPPLSGPG